MNESLASVMEDGARRVNRSCAIAACLVLAVCAVALPLGFAGVWVISSAWMYFYLASIVLPLLAIVVYARKRDYRGRTIRYLMIVAASLIPASMSVPSLFGFFLMPLPIVVAGRYFSRSMVWKVYLLTLVLTLVMMVPHTWYGTPCYPLCEEARESLQLYLDGRFDRLRYLRYLGFCCFPSFAVCLSFFAFTMDRLCLDHLGMLERQAKVNARLADVEKGLTIAATMQLAGAFPVPRGEPSAKATSASELDVSDWSMRAIVDCIAKCKKRAAEDPAFAELVERDPAAAVREVRA